MESHIFGYPRMGHKSELKSAFESYWYGKSSAEELQNVSADLGSLIWKSCYDQVLDTTAMLGAVPDRFNWNGGKIGYDTLFSVTTGNAAVPVMEMTKWFDTNYQYIVPELGTDVKSSYASHKAVNECKEAKGAFFSANAAAQASRKSSPRVTNEAVQKAAASLKVNLMDDVDSPDEQEDDCEEAEFIEGDEGEQVSSVVQMLMLNPKQEKNYSLFKIPCMIEQKVCNVIIDSGSIKNVVSSTLVKALNLKTEPHPKPYAVSWIKNEVGVPVTEICKVDFSISEDYKDNVTFDVVEMDVCDILLGRPWLSDRDVTHRGRANTYSFQWGEKEIVLTPSNGDEISNAKRQRLLFLQRIVLVEYFGEQLSGSENIHNSFTFTANGWVQSYGSRCVKPPIISSDVSRPKAMTVFWSSMAHSMTARPMKGMLNGPVTILNWSFVRNDQPRFETCYQIALAIKDEVEDLEKAGINVIQIDEAALREGLPLRKAEHAFYLDRAVHSFRITNCGVQDTCQIHTHMCYSNFNDIIHSIIDMDADVITIENSRSDEKLLSVFREGVKYGAGIGPGVYDIHSPRIPSTEEIADRINKMLAVLETNILWVNPDCGLKTRKYTEVKPALQNMVAAAKLLRNQLAGAK